MASEPVKPEQWTPKPKNTEGATKPLLAAEDGGDTIAWANAVPPAPGPSFPVGFELIRRLGEGGFSDVYLAHDLTTRREVAMKFIRHPESSVQVASLIAEVRTLAGLDHPNIVRLYSADFQQTNPYIAMEYLRGGSLAQRLVEGPLPPDESARIIATVARAVHAAHAAGVIHRNLKPRNILFAADSTPKVSGFGLAKFENEAPRDKSATADSDGPLGTPAYMPPEQISRAHTVGPTADVYGLGATLYHLTTGRPPFHGNTPRDVFAHIEHDPPERPRDLRPEVPARLEAIVLKCLEKDPAKRYPTAMELAEDLEHFLRKDATRTPPEGWAARIWRRLVRSRRQMPPARESPVEPSLTRATRILAGNIRPEDYLAVPDEDVTFVDGSEARSGVRLLPEYRQKMISSLALQYHYAGNELLVRHTPDGVIVLAVGSEEVDRVAHGLSPEQQALASIEFPTTLLDDRPLSLD